MATPSEAGETHEPPHPFRLHGIIGFVTDPALKERLHRVEHRDGIEYLFVDEAEAGRKRFRQTTDRGTDCAVSLERNDVLSEGAILHLDDRTAVVVRFGAPRVWRLRPRDAEAALRLGWNAGNLHWRVQFENDVLVVRLDGPLADYRARLAPMLAEGSIAEVIDD